MYEELKDFDPVYSMAQTVELVGKALKDIDSSEPLSKSDSKMIKLIEEKMDIAEDWYERPLDSVDIYAKLMEIAELAGELKKAERYRKQMALFEANQVEFLGRQQEFYGNSVEAIK